MSQSETKATDIELTATTDEEASAKSPNDDVDTIKVRCLTWNVGNTKPDFTELTHILNLEELKYHDLIVVGTQENAYKGEHSKLGHTASKLDVSLLKKIDSNEIVNTKDATANNAKRVTSELDNIVEEDNILDVEEGVEDDVEDDGATDKLAQNKSSSNMVDLKQITVLHNEWEVEICKHMGPEWSILERDSFGEMKLFILVHTGDSEESEWAHRNVAVGLGKATSACGIGGVGNNKGGIAISFHIRDTYLSFISAHLNAHLEHEKRRNSDHAEIRRETQSVGNAALDVCEDVDHCIWMGDLNYRCDIDRSIKDKSKKHTKEENWATVKKMIDNKEYDNLLKIDQLNLAKKDGLAWYRFNEGKIAFDPTFKVLKKKAGPGHYKAQRIPSYCDRVLYKSAPHTEGNLTVQKYTGCPEVSTSDHKPVIADLFIKVSTPPKTVYSFLHAGRIRGERLSASGAESSPEDHFHIEKRKNIWPVVMITNLSGENIVASDLDLRGKTSDPYVEFHSNPKDLLWHHPHKDGGDKRYPPITKVLPNTLNPKWDDDVVS